MRENQIVIICSLYSLHVHVCVCMCTFSSHIHTRVKWVNSVKIAKIKKNSSSLDFGTKHSDRQIYTLPVRGDSQFAKFNACKNDPPYNVICLYTCMYSSSQIEVSIA